MTLCIAWTVSPVQAIDIRRVSKCGGTWGTGALRQVGTRAIGSSRPEVYRGYRKQLVLLVSFSDKDFVTADPLTEYGRLLNETGFSDHGAKGSVREYFEAQSNGQFVVDFDVVGPVKLDHVYSYYGKNNSWGDDSNAGAMVRDACQQAADAGLVSDWSRYDWDGDGQVEQVIVVYAGEGEHLASDENLIWPHHNTLASTAGKLTVGGMEVNMYVCINEYIRVGGYQGIGTFGILCHEFGHCMGLPDLYNTSTSFENYVMDEWDLYDGGDYTGEGFFCPIGFSGYERVFCGWADFTVLSAPLSVRGLETPANGGAIYQILNDGNSDEYYILENRQQEGWDTYLPGHGLLVTHVDYSYSPWASNKVNGTKGHYRLDLIYANNLTYYDTGSERLRYAAYPYQDNDSLTDLSVPAATLYNINTDGTQLMHKPVTHITETEGLISFDFMKSTVGIDSPAADRSKKIQSVYHLTDRIDIIRYTDGSVRKVFVSSGTPDRRQTHQ